MISTIRGFMSEDSLEILKTEEQAPCGTVVTTIYKDLLDGVVVRQDIEVKATTPFIVHNKAGFFSKIKQGISNLFV